mgnify:CR=1 FL=1
MRPTGSGSGPGAIIGSLARFLRSAILLAAALLPLAMQAGAVLDLLDAGRVAHPAAIVELLVHGHNHGKAVVTHAHLAPAELDRLPHLRAPEATPAGPAFAARGELDTAPVQRLLDAPRGGDSTPPKFLLNAALLR